MYKHNFYFEISAEAGMSQDIETGENDSCLAMVGLEFSEQKTNEEYEAMKPKIKLMLANQIDIPEEWITMISKDEYEELTDEE